MPAEPVIEAKEIEKSFLVGQQTVPVLKGVTAQIGKGEFLIMVGPSGCGKSTLLHTMLGLEPPSKGLILFGGKDIYAMSDDNRAEFRKTRIGLVPQQANWVKALSVVENVAFPLNLLGWKMGDAVMKARHYLEMVEMLDWAHYKPTELSSGQQQRIALARALTCDPLVLIADEPTGNLDTHSGANLMHILAELNKKGRTIVMVTHDIEYLTYASRVVQMLDGKIVASCEGSAKDRLVGELLSTSGLWKRRGGEENKQWNYPPSQNTTGSTRG